MRSLYQHEAIAHTYAEHTDDELVEYAGELYTIKETSEIARQRKGAAWLLELLAFEAASRITEYKSE